MNAALAALLLLLLATPEPGAAPPPAEPMALDRALTICRTVYFIDSAKGKAMFEAVPAEQQALLVMICLSYRQGAEDLDTARQLQALEEASAWTR